MKKFAVILMVVMMLLAMSACGNVTPVENDSQTENSTVAENATEDTATTNDSSSSTETSGADSTTKPAESSKPKESSKPTETSKPAESTKAAHAHSWNPVYKTVHHDAVTHTVHHNAEYKETKTPKSYKVQHETARFVDKTFDPYDFGYDMKAYNNAVWNYQMQLAESDIECGFDCPAVTHTISTEVYNKVKSQVDFYIADPCEYNTVKTLVKDAYDETVVDKAAYDEKVIDYYKCDCGATK